jgi:hypothetical protein
LIGLAGTREDKPEQATSVMDEGSEYNYNYDYENNYESSDALKPFIVINEHINEINRLQLDVGADGGESQAKELEKHIEHLILQAEHLLRLTSIQLNKLTLKFETGEEDVIAQVKQNVREFAHAYRDTMRNMSKAFNNLDGKRLSNNQAQAIVDRIQQELEDELDELDHASGNLIDAIDVYVDVFLKEHLGDIGDVLSSGLSIISEQIKIEISIELRNLLLNLELFDLHAGSRVIQIGDRTIIINRDSEAWDNLKHDIHINISVDDIEAEIEELLEELDDTLDEVFDDVEDVLEEVFENFDDWMDVFFHEKMKQKP